MPAMQNISRKNELSGKNIVKMINKHKCKVCRFWQEDGCHCGGGAWGTPGKGLGRHDGCFEAAQWALDAIKENEVWTI